MRGDDPASFQPVGITYTVFPACAGMIPTNSPVNPIDGSVPRMRGDDPENQWKDYGRT